MSRPIGQGEKTKQKIALNAKKLFEIKGYKSTSIANIQEASELSKGIFYHHFDSKEDVYLYCLKEASTLMIEQWENKSKITKSSREKLYILAELYAEDSQSALTKTIPPFLASNTKDHLQKIVTKIISSEIDIFKSIIEEGVYNKEFRKELDIIETAYILYGTLVNVSSTEYFGYKKNIKHVYHQFVHLFLDGIASE